MTAVAELLVRLRTFWRRQGAVDLPTAAVVVSDPVLAPDVFLRLITPCEWSVGQMVRYRSPETARPHRSPFSCARSLAYQVAASPGEVGACEKFLESLRAMGLEYTQHDVRFANHPFLLLEFGLSGDGWTVTLDGLPVARIHYLTCAAGETLDPVVLAITYLIEPLALQESESASTEQLVWEAKGTRYHDSIAVGDDDYGFRGTGEELSISLRSADAHYRHACLALETGRPFAAFESLAACDAAVSHFERGSEERLPWVERLRATSRRAALMTRELNRRDEQTSDQAGQARTS